MKSLAATLFALALLAPKAACCGEDSQISSGTLVNYCTSGDESKVNWCGAYVHGVVDALCPRRSTTASSLYYDLMSYLTRRVQQGSSEALPADAADVVAKVICNRPPEPARQPQQPVAQHRPRTLDLVGEQIERCWIVPETKPDNPNPEVELRVYMNPDGTVNKAELQHAEKLSDPDPMFRAAAEAATRATMNPACQPLKLPPDKYDQWFELTAFFESNGNVAIVFDYLLHDGG
jgi:hypothetical protein